jgi:hypothetical protein
VPLDQRSNFLPEPQKHALWDMRPGMGLHRQPEETAIFPVGSFWIFYAAENSRR